MASVGELEEGLDSVRWGAQYLINAHPSPFKFYGQYGISDIDFDYFGPPEEYEMHAEPKPIYALTPQDPGTEIIAQASAALTASAIAWKPYDPAWSDLCLRHAKELYQFATQYQRSFMNSTQYGFRDHVDWYPSFTGYHDEIIMAAAWLHLATNESSYLAHAEALYATHILYGGWGYSWDEKGPGIHLLLMKANNSELYHFHARQYFSAWMPGPLRTIPHTPKGLAYPYHWGANRYAANTAFLAFVYSDFLRKHNSSDPFATQVYDYGVSQINYLLGANGRSWVVGFGHNYPLRPYHKSSYNSYLIYPLRTENVTIQRNDFMYSLEPNRFILYGALVGSPFINDSFVDTRQDYEYTEVTQDYNAAFTGAIAALVNRYGGEHFPDDGLDLGWNYPGADHKPVYRTIASQFIKTATSAPTVRPSTSSVAPSPSTTTVAVVPTSNSPSTSKEPSSSSNTPPTSQEPDASTMDTRVSSTVATTPSESETISTTESSTIHDDSAESSGTALQTARVLLTLCIVAVMVGFKIGMCTACGIFDCAVE
jgi:hypothetical protein